MSSKSPAKALRPDLSLEQSINGPVCGLDEVGRGPLAGPVVAACVYIPEEHYTLPFVLDIRDSKKLSEKKLEALYTQITEHFDWAVAEHSPAQIDEHNILQASLRTMADAMSKISCTPVHALVDGNKLPQSLTCSATAVVKGDSKSASIAAASIVAKVTRDRLMRALHEKHPHYGWDRNVGYPTKEHLAAIDSHGITEHHRKSFGPVKNFIAFGATRKPIETAA